MINLKENWKKLPKWLRIVIYSILGVLGMAALGVLFGFVIMWLWNWIMPAVFGLKAITYWQGVGIFILAKILFGAIGSSGNESKKPKDKKESQFDSNKADDRKAETDAEKYYDQWWEKEGKAAFDDFVNDQAAEKTRERDAESE